LFDVRTSSARDRFARSVPRWTFRSQAIGLRHGLTSGRISEGRPEKLCKPIRIFYAILGKTSPENKLRFGGAFCRSSRATVTVSHQSGIRRPGRYPIGFPNSIALPRRGLTRGRNSFDDSYGPGVSEWARLAGRLSLPT